MRVLEELLKFDKSIVTTSRNRITDSTPLHVATEGGHTDVVKLLLSCGASPLDENKVQLQSFEKEEPGSKTFRCRLE